MARHDLLSVFGLESLAESLAAPPEPRWGRVEAGIQKTPLEFCSRLGEGVLVKFREQPHFLAAEPVLLGSWARGELCPGSDLDLLFAGPEEAVREVVGWAQNRGIKIRSRLPENPEDWSAGVELWDHLSLLDGVAFTPRAQAGLAREQKGIREAPARVRRQWLTKFRKERRERHERFDSIQNLLEPQLKMGLGGLRDLQQARLIEKIDPSLETADIHEGQLFEYYRRAFLWIRILLHLQGERDLLSSSVQPEIARHLGFADYRELMNFVQRGLSRVSFYSDWMLERALRPAPRVVARGSLADRLIRDPGVLTQHEVRRSLGVEAKYSKSPSDRLKRGRELRKFFRPSVNEHHWLALFRSRLMDRLVPELKPLVGFVQHDQYHRFTADAHILQVIREVLRAEKKPGSLGPLAKMARELTAVDWQILRWTALYHDLAKGRPQDHESLGAEWVRRDLKGFGVPDRQTREVEWLVREHLLFSHAALRRDASDPGLLRELASHDLNEGRIKRLLVFTALDIRGTNPTAMNEWKARLLRQLGERLLAPERQQEEAILRLFPRLHPEDQNRLLGVKSAVGLSRLKKDLALVQKNPTAFAFYKTGRQLWVRYHRARDQKGILARVLGLFFQAGASVVQSTVLTVPGLGVYDWFCLETSSSAESLEKRLRLLETLELPAPPKVTWDSVELVQSKNKRWSLLFRGPDQRGILWSAAAALTELDCEIKAAQVQTWGEKAEDLIVIEEGTKEPKAFLQSLRTKLNLK